MNWKRIMVTFAIISTLGLLRMGNQASELVQNTTAIGFYLLSTFVISVVVLFALKRLN